ncbi:MAG: HRDC domain-containing protein [Thiolinea sp.]
MKRKAGKTRKQKQAEQHSVRAADQPLWDALKQVRLRLAQAQGVPPYVIFHDSTLLEMIVRRPKTLMEMGQVSGIGAQKL